MSERLSPREQRILSDLVGKVGGLQKQVGNLERAQHARLTTIHAGDGTGIQVVGDDDRVVSRIGGKSALNGDPVQYVDGPDPSKPAAPLVVSDEPGLALVELVDAPPADLRVCRVLASLESGSAGAPVGSIWPGEDTTVVSPSAGVWYVRLQWVTKSGKESELSDPVTVEVEPPVDAQDLQDTLDAAQARLDEYADEVAAPRFQALETGLSENNDSLENARTRLSAAEQTLSPLPARIESAEENVATAQDEATKAAAAAVEANNRAMTRLANGNFESDLLYWDHHNVSLTSTAHSGQQAAQIDGWLRPGSSFPVVPDQIWELSLYHQYDVTVEFQAIDGDQRATLSTHHLDGDSSWSDSGALRVTIPADVHMLSFTITGTGTVVDDITLRDVTDVVRLEEAANANRQKAEQAISELAVLQLAVDGEGGLKDRLTTAETVLGTKADESALDQLDQKLAGNLAAFESHYTRVWRQPTPPPAGTSYEWAGERHASESIKKVDGQEVARNLAHNPRGATTSGTVIVVPDYDGEESPDPDFDLVDGNLVAPKPVRGKPQGGVLYYSRKNDALALRRRPDDTGNMFVLSLDRTRNDGMPIALAAHVWSETNTDSFTARCYIINGTSAGNYQTITGGRGVVIESGTESGGAWGGFNVTQAFLSPGDTFYFRTHLATADSEEAALAQIEHYFDGSTPSDRAHDLWYNTDGVPHEWVNGQGWTAISDARITELASQVNTLGDRLETAETGLEEALEGPIDHDRLRVGTGAFDEAFASKLIADHATIINAAMRNLSVEEKLLFAEAIGEQVWAELGVFDRLDAREAYVGGAHIKEGAITADKITATRELITKILGVDYAYVAELLVVEGDLIANNATLINAAMQTLSVTERADFVQAFAEQIYSKESITEVLIAGAAWIDGTLIEEGAIKTPHLTVTEDMVGNFAEFLHLVVDHMDVNSIWADESWQNAGHFGSEDADQQTNVDGTGVTLYRKIDGEFIPAAIFGGGDVQLAFFDENNESTGAITQDGQVSGTAANFQSYTWQGRPLVGRSLQDGQAPILDSVTHSFIARNRRVMGQTDGAGQSEYGFLPLTFHAIAGMTYEIIVPGLRMWNISESAIIHLEIHYTTEVRPPVLSDPTLGNGAIATTANVGNQKIFQHMSRFFHAEEDCQVNLLLAVRTDTGNDVATWWHSSNNESSTAEMLVRPTGITPEIVGGQRDVYAGHPDLGGGEQSYYTGWTPTWHQAYMGTGLYTGGSEKILHGYDPNNGQRYSTHFGGYRNSTGYSGNEDSGKTMNQALAGAFITEGTLTITGAPNTNPSGMVWIQWHTHQSAPDTFVSEYDTRLIQSAQVTAGQQSVIDLPRVVLDAIQADTLEGFTLHHPTHDGPWVSIHSQDSTDSRILQPMMRLRYVR